MAYENAHNDRLPDIPVPDGPFVKHGYRPEYRTPFLCNQGSGPSLRQQPAVYGQFLAGGTLEPRTNL